MPAGGLLREESCGTIAGSSCEIDCLEGKTLVGAAILSCLNDGSWTNTDVKCQGRSFFLSEASSHVFHRYGLLIDCRQICHPTTAHRDLAHLLLTDFNACLDAEANPCDERRSICIDLLAEEYIDSPGKLGHVCRCREGYGGSPGGDGSGCTPTRIEADSTGLHMGVGRGLDIAAVYARSGAEEQEVISLGQLRSDVAALQGADGAVTSVATAVEGLAAGPVKSNADALSDVAARLTEAADTHDATRDTLTSAEGSAQVRSSGLLDLVDQNGAVQQQLTSTVDDIELDVLGLATDIGTLGDKFGDLQAQVKAEIEDGVGCLL